MPGSCGCGSIMDTCKALRRGGIFVAVSLPIYSLLWSCWWGMMNVSGMNQNTDCAWRLWHVTEVPKLCRINTIFMIYPGYGSNGFKGYGGEPIRGKTHSSDFYIYQLWGVIYFLLWNNTLQDMLLLMAVLVWVWDISLEMKEQRDRCKVWPSYMLWF